MTEKRKLTSPPAAKAPSVEAEEEAVEEEPSFHATDEESHEEEPASGDEPEQQTDENSQPDVPPAEAGGGEDGDEDEKDPSSIHKLLEPFPKDHLIELLRDAALKHPDVLAEVHRIADLDPVHRKIFVHGLGWDTNAQTLTSAFRRYGEIEDCNAVVDKATGKSKGYGFILFKHRVGDRRALKEPQKKIGNRMTACQLASAGPVPPPAPPLSEYTQRKISVSNVGSEIDPQKLLQFFSKFGEIEEGPLGLDKSFDFEFVDGRRMLCGDIAPVALSEEEGEYSELEYVTKICQRAINENKDWSVELGSILKANCRASQYVTYYVTFLGRDTRDSSTKTYQLALMMNLITDKPEHELEVLLFREKPSEEERKMIISMKNRKALEERDSCSSRHVTFSSNFSLFK